MTSVGNYNFRQQVQAEVSGAGTGRKANVLGNRFHMQVSLRVRDLHAMLMEKVPHAKQHLVFHVRAAVHRVLDPDTDLKVHGTVPETRDQTGGYGRAQHPLDAVGRALAQLDGQSHVRLVVNSERNPQAYVFMAVRPVLHAVGDELLVRHQVLDAVSGDHRDIARTQGLHPAVLPGHEDGIPGLDRLVGQQDEACDEVREDLLQAKSEAHADGPAEHHQGREIDADGAEREQEGRDDDQDLEDLGGQHLGRSREPLACLDACLEHAHDEQPQPQEHGHGNGRGHDIVDTEGRGAEVKRPGIQEFDQGDQQTEYMQGGDPPDEGRHRPADQVIGNDR